MKLIAGMPRSVQGIGIESTGMLVRVLGVAWIEQFAGKRNAGTAENVFGPNSLFLLDDEGLSIAVDLAAPNTNTVAPQQFFHSITVVCGRPVVRRIGAFCHAGGEQRCSSIGLMMSI